MDFSNSVHVVSHQSGAGRGKRKVENKLGLNGGKTNALLTQAFNI